MASIRGSKLRLRSYQGQNHARSLVQYKGCKMKTLYICEGCGRKFNQSEDAALCEGRTSEPTVKVGDIVLARSGFGWYGGDVAWISNPKHTPCKSPGTNCFDTCCTYSFYYVVTAIDYESHRVRYHLATMAMSEENDYRYGYTYDQHHCTPEKVENPPADVVEQSKTLIGHVARGLI